MKERLTFAFNRYLDFYREDALEHIELELKLAVLGPIVTWSAEAPLTVILLSLPALFLAMQLIHLTICIADSGPLGREEWLRRKQRSKRRLSEMSSGPEPALAGGMTGASASGATLQLPELSSESDQPAEPEQTAPPRGKLRKAFGYIAVPLAFLLSKAKLIVLVISKLKFFSTGFSMLISIGSYAIFWGWKFALGFVLLLFVHEWGHVLQLRREGIRATAPMFIPFLGAVVGMKEMPKDAAAEARVGLAGPVLGSLACLVPALIWILTGSELFQGLAYTGLFLNLFNLLPVVPLDGGRAMAALSPWVWFLGLLLLVGLLVLIPNPIIFLILVFGFFEVLRRFRERKSPEGQAYLAVPGKQRALIAAVYIGLVVLLMVGMDLTYLEHPTRAALA